MKVTTEINKDDFFSAFLETQQDAVYYALSAMHDLIVLEKVNIDNPEKALEDIKELLKVFTNKRRAHPIREF